MYYRHVCRFEWMDQSGEIHISLHSSFSRKIEPGQFSVTVPVVFTDKKLQIF